MAYFYGESTIDPSLHVWYCIEPEEGEYEWEMEEEEGIPYEWRYRPAAKRTRKIGGVRRKRK